MAGIYGSGLTSGSGGGLISGVGTENDIAELTKALSDDGHLANPLGGLAAGSDINAPAVHEGVGFPLRVESLDSTLFNVTYRSKDAKFFKSLAKESAANTIEEFNQLSSYGTGVSTFMEEGDIPTIDDSTYKRNYLKIKYMGVTRRVSHVMSVVNSAVGDVVARETVNGTLFLLRQLERALFEGNSDLVPVQFDGLEKLMTDAFDPTPLADGMAKGYNDDNCIDLRGSHLDQDKVADLTEVLVSEPNYGSPSDLWLAPGPMKDLSRALYGKELYMQPSSPGMFGAAATGLVTPFGNIAFNPDIFIPTSGLANAATIGDSAKIPGAPTFQSAANGRAFSASATETHKFVAADDGAYIYKVVACNRHGKAAAVASGAATIDVGAGSEVVAMTIRDSTFSDADRKATYYEVYRTKAGGAADTARLILKVKANAASQDTVIVDMNRFLPGCSKGYMLTQSSDVIKWKSLAPFTKIPLATIDSSIRWMQLLYGGLLLGAPKKCGMFINVGPKV